MRDAGLSRAIRLIACRAPWSAVAVTEQVFTTTTSASAAAVAIPPRARKSSSRRNESAWLTRQPNVTMEYFIRLATRGSSLDVARDDPERSRRVAGRGSHSTGSYSFNFSAACSTFSASFLL